MKRFLSAMALLSVFFVSSDLGAAEAGIEYVEEGGAGKVLPKVIAQPAQTLPSSLVKSGLSGTVVVSFTVDEKGRVRDAVVTRSPHRQLNSPAIKVVGSWRFEPGSRDGQPAAFGLRALVEFISSEGITSIKPAEGTPTPKHKPPMICPYELVVSGEAAWADASFVVDYLGRPLFAVTSASSNKAFGKAVIAMVEATEYNPGKKGAYRTMSPASEHYQYDGEASLDPEARRVLAELRKSQPSILAASELDERPKVLKQVAPTYPRALKDDGLTGQAEIEFIVSRDGSVLFPKINSATHEDFGWAASVAVAQWRYQPPQKDGRAVEVRVVVPIVFTAQKLAEAD
jgi:TonB family protein